MRNMGGQWVVSCHPVTRAGQSSPAVATSGAEPVARTTTVVTPGRHLGSRAGGPHHHGPVTSAHVPTGFTPRSEREP